jgi:hypothetical protein
VLDTVWTRRTPDMGERLRYADDFVVMCDTNAACERAEQRVRETLARLGLELHPDKNEADRSLVRTPIFQRLASTILDPDLSRVVPDGCRLTRSACIGCGAG